MWSNIWDFLIYLVIVFCVFQFPFHPLLFYKEVEFHMGHGMAFFSQLDFQTFSNFYPRDMRLKVQHLIISVIFIFLTKLGVIFIFYTKLTLDFLVSDLIKCQNCNKVKSNYFINYSCLSSWSCVVRPRYWYYQLTLDSRPHYYRIDTNFNCSAGSRWWSQTRRTRCVSRRSRWRSASRSLSQLSGQCRPSWRTSGPAMTW